MLFCNYFKQIIKLKLRAYNFSSLFLITRQIIFYKYVEFKLMSMIFIIYKTHPCPLPFQTILPNMYIYIYIKCECPDQLAHTSTNLTGPEVNDHVSLQWPSYNQQPQGSNLRPQGKQTPQSQVLTTRPPTIQLNILLLLLVGHEFIFLFSLYFFFKISLQSN